MVLFAVLFSPFYANAVPGSFSVEVSGNTYDINYDVEGMTIVNIEPNLEEIGLLLEVVVTQSPGIMEITFDREFFDAQIDNFDDVFIVLADGDWVDPQELETTTDSRTLSMELPLGTEEVEIFGTELAGVTFGEEIPEVEQEVIEEEPPAEEEVMEEEPEVIEEEVVEEEPEVVEEKVMEEETPKTQCGPGTVLKDGVCVLDEKCGPGTHLEDGVCVLNEKTSGGSSLTDRPTSTQFIFGAVAAFIIAIIIVLILYIISRGSRQKQQPTVKP